MKTPGRLGALMAVVFFTSGATSLVYETLWLRGFSIVLGGTVYSMSCVLTAFMGGLAIGASLASRYVARLKAQGRASFIRAYGVLEIAIGLYGLAITIALFEGQSTWLALVGGLQASASPALTLFIHFTFSLVALAFPTLCMGATLPVLVMGLEDARDTVSLYSFNTFGAAAGSLLASFVLIYFFGVLVSTAIVTAVNLVIGVVAFWLASRVTGERKEEALTAAAGTTWSPRLLGGLGFFSGLVFFAFELVWNRTLSLLLGNRVYVMSITLAVVLLCLGLGARLCQRLLRTRSAQHALMDTYLVAAVSLCVGLLAEAALQRESPALTALFVLASIPIPAIAMGVAFPLLLSLTPRDVGRLYAANTLGSMVGSLVTGYVLFAALGSNRIVLTGIAIILVAWLLLARVGDRPAVSRLSLMAVTVLVVLTFWVRWNARLSTVPPEPGQLIDEDAYGIFSITPTAKGYLSVRCNATELVYLFGSPATQYVQESQSHFPLLFATHHEQVLVIGSGYGITAGAAASWPTVGHVDAVEILPLMVAHAERFASGNQGYHRHPRVTVHVADGRHFMAAAGHKYDVISINVSDPYLPGSASLFSTEFYELVTASLAPDGVVCQHLFGPDVVSLYHGFKRHFRYVAMVPSYDNGVSVLGSQTPLEPRQFSALSDPKLAAVLANVGLGSREALEQWLAVGARLQERLEKQPPLFLNSDVHPELEFRRSPDVSLLMSNF